MSIQSLVQKGKIGKLELKNRIVMPPMGVGVGDGSGYVTEKDIAYYEARAKGGVGLIVSACCSVTPELCGMASFTDPNLSLPGVEEGFKKLMDRVHQYGTKMIIQLLHMGRQGVSMLNNGQQVVAPSAIPENDFMDTPRELTNEEVKFLINAYVKAAKVVLDAGADGVELHCAHGYLIHQFISARANKRTDEYGGSFENRMRFVTEIVEGIKAIRPENTIISVRMNAKDGFEGGYTIEDGQAIAKYFEKIGIDCINVSHGTYTNSFVITEPGLFPEGCRSEQIKAIKDAVSIPVIAVNNIKRASTANNFIESGICDYVALGRGLLCDPNFAAKAMAGEPETIRSCISCDNCLAFAVTGGHSTCSLNPYLGEETVYNENTLVKSGEGKKAAIIGAGPGGMNAAEVLAAKGYEVTLFDKNDVLGGALTLASKGKGKDKIQWTIDGYAARLAKAGVKVVLNKKIESADDLKELNPDVVIVAIGGSPVVPPVKGVDLPNVKLAHDILADSKGIEGKSIAIVGSGMTGLETAEVLVEQGNTVRLYDMLDEIAKGAEMTNKIADMNFLGTAGVAFNVNHKMKEITTEGVLFENLATNEEVFDKADLVVLSLGVRANVLPGITKDSFEKVLFIGDCVKPARIVDATHNGFDEIWNL